jgi:hypothetical protein
MTVFDFAKELVKMDMVIVAGENSFEVRYKLNMVIKAPWRLSSHNTEELSDILADCVDYWEREVQE